MLQTVHYRLRPVMHRCDAFFVCAMGAAIIIAAGFNSVPDNLASAMLALRSKGVNGAFETVEITRDAVDDDFQWFVVFVSADFADVHNLLRSPNVLKFCRV